MAYDDPTPRLFRFKPYFSSAGADRTRLQTAKTLLWAMRGAIAMRIHLVALDLDGTLLNSAKEITDATEAILRAARQEANLRIVLATARPPRSVMPYYRHLELDTPMINYNGALIYDPPGGRVIMHRPLSLKTSRQIVRIARGAYPDVLVSAEILDRWYTDRLDQTYLTETGKKFQPNVIAPINQWLTRSVTKMLLLGEPGRLAELGRIIRQDLLHQVSVVQTEDVLLQVTHPTVSKGQALRTVASELGVSQETVMAIGDNANDVSMLKWAAIGVAMANSAPKALDAANFVAEHHDVDGAAKAIRDLILHGLPEA